ncbi:integrase [Rhodoblastus acidophilus]|uniref:tyrosine-type recombinase/integrase n=1 Tax=Rhodoblastus acidophilus TaxID=1074 RepID=UPI002224CFD5|nr:site-specific integrase [Rhodoblastus acidophilus]MCW2317640.1 integrase [Rhodoblastus acidophilus]
MAITLNRLNAKTVAAITSPGRHSDGGGLYLSVSKTGGKSWVFFYKLNGRQREMGFGAVHAVTLAKARELAVAARGDLAAKIDPLDKRRQEREKPATKTFGEVAAEYVTAHQHEWRNEKHVHQWTSALQMHAAPLWKVPIDAIDTDDVVATLAPLWSRVPETARRVRGRIEAILDAAKVRKLRTGDNPARWRGHLDKLLAAPTKLVRGHHAAIPYDRMPAFWLQLAPLTNMSYCALRFLILTAARSGEVRGATWDEIDFENAVWTVPAERMKAGRPHRVPLSRAAVALLEKMRELKTSDLIFPGHRGNKMSDMTMSAAMKRICDDATPHGFRSTFRDWAGDETHFPREVAEAALAHVVGNKVEAAYRRSDALEKRRALMEQWAVYVTTSPADGGKVVPFAKQAS